MYENFKVRSDVSIAGYRWHCNKPEQVICLLHGIGEHQGRYDRMAAIFNEAGIAAVGMDHRGHGISQGVRGHTAPRESVLSDIDGLIDYAKSEYPDLPLILYGHSMGGNIAMDYRIRGNLSNVPSAYIISAPWIKLCRHIPAPVPPLVRTLSKVAPRLQFASGIDEKFLGNMKNTSSYSGNPMVHNKITTLCTVEGFDIGNKLWENSLEGNCGGRGKPLLLMHGTADKICSIEGSRRIASFEENCRYVELDGYFHEVHNGNDAEDGGKAIEIMIEFIKEVAALS